MKVSLSVCCLFIIFGVCLGASILENGNFDNATDLLENAESLNNTNETVPQDLYVIKTVVYEVGILTNASDTDDNSTENHEKIDLSFYDPSYNGSIIDLSNISMPIQTNVSEVQVTGILPTNLGSITIPENGSSPQFNSTFPVLPNQVVVTQNISTSDPMRGSDIIYNLPEILGLNRTETE